MTAATAQPHQHRRSSWSGSSSNRGGGSSRELRSSVRNLLLDLSGTGTGSQRRASMQRKDSLKLMDVPDSKVPNRPSSSRDLKQQQPRGSVVYNKKDNLLVEQFYNVTLTRDSLEDSWGLSFNQIDGNLILTKIAPGKMADEQTDLKVGDLIWTINDTEVKSPATGDLLLSPQQAGEILKQATTACIRVKKPTFSQWTYVEANLKRISTDQSWGFKVGRAPDGAMVVKKTHRGGLAVQQSNLRPGYELLDIDNVNCTHGSGMSTEDVANKLKQAKQVVLRAKKPTLGSGTRILRAVLEKETVNTPVGLDMVEKETKLGDPEPHIAHIERDSAAYHSILEPGFIVEAITFFNSDGLVDLHFRGGHFTESQFTNNGNASKGWTIAEVATMLAEAPAGTITLRARVPPAS